MTNFEAISAELYPYNVDDSVIRKACINCTLDPEGSYHPSNDVGIAKSTIKILQMLICLASEGNGGYSLGYDADKLKERIFILASDNGLSDIADEFDIRSSISDASDLW
mgnify:CR=1 FL=1